MKTTYECLQAVQQLCNTYNHAEVTSAMVIVNKLKRAELDLGEAAQVRDLCEANNSIGCVPHFVERRVHLCNRRIVELKERYLQ